MVVVQLVKVGSEVRTFDVSNNPTLGNLLNIAGESFVPNTITINSTGEITSDTVLFDKDRVFIGNRVKGNLPYVAEFIRLGQHEVVHVSAEGETTISECIGMMSPQNKACFVDANGKDCFQYQISGVTMQSEDIIPEPQPGGTVRILCAMKVKGN